MKDIEKLLPHREPFLFVDEIEKADENETINKVTVAISLLPG